MVIFKPRGAAGWSDVRQTLFDDNYTEAGPAQECRRANTRWINCNKRWINATENTFNKIWRMILLRCVQQILLDENLKFFRVYSQGNWPARTVVREKEICLGNYVKGMWRSLKWNIKIWNKQLKIWREKHTLQNSL